MYDFLFLYISISLLVFFGGLQSRTGKPRKQGALGMEQRYKAWKARGVGEGTKIQSMESKEWGGGGVG